MADSANRTGAVMVVGGGIAGIQASLDLAEMGYYVYLVEKSPAIGGRMAQLDKTFPTNDCSMCIISPKLNDCGGHINVETITNAEVLEVTGEPGSMTARVLKKARYIDLDKCTSCGECTKVCPIDLPNEFNMGIDFRKVTYKPYAQAYPNAFAISKQDISPCTVTCPAHVNAHGYVSLVARGQYKEAMEVILDVLPLPGTLGRVCAHPCEFECRRGQVDDPIAIKDLKRLAADQIDIHDIELQAADPQPEKVAIIGAGPAGLSAAYHLARKGYPSIIFEALPVPGGMLRVGIPDYRLPPEVLNNEVDFITNLGVEIRYNTALGRDITIDGLFEEGYAAVFLGMGAHGSRSLNVEGEDAEGIIPVTTFLREASLGHPPEIGRKVLVIGGGNVAVDAARTAVRLRDCDVTMIALENEEELPAWEWEVEEALEEGVSVMHRWGPRRFLTENGRVAGIELKSVTCVFDEAGRFSPAYDETCLETIEADTVIVAIGQAPSNEGLDEKAGVTLGRGDNIEADPVTPWPRHARGFLPAATSSTAPGLPSMPWPRARRPPCPLSGTFKAWTWPRVASLWSFRAMKTGGRLPRISRSRPGWPCPNVPLRSGSKVLWRSNWDWTRTRPRKKRLVVWPAAPAAVATSASRPACPRRSPWRPMP